MEYIAIVLANIAAILIIAPIIDGIERKIKAKLQCRKGPPILQTWYDLVKLFRRPSIVTEEYSLAYVISPYIIFANMILALALVPSFTRISLSFFGDIIVLVYLIASSSIFLAIGSISSGNVFATIGANREISLATLSKLLMALVLATFATLKRALTLGSIFPIIPPCTLSAIISIILFAIIAYIDCYKLPFDIPEAEPEIIDGILVEYSGKSLGVLKYSTYLKRILLFTIIVDLILPGNIPTLLLPISYFIFLLALSITYVCIETYFGRLRIDQALKFMKTMVPILLVVWFIAYLHY
ncbi:MAG: formate hydrogenlyase subunit 4 [Thermoprotei archaeon]|nr:MAG: formate hydrogenlyase subunit 4 [Thermoprotei archaeon]